MSPHISPEAIQPFLPTRRPRPRDLKHPARNPEGPPLDLAERFLSTWKHRPVPGHDKLLWLYSKSEELDDDGSVATPLHVAASFGKPKLVTFLISSGSNPNLLDGEGYTALFRAVECGHEAVVRVLLENETVDANLKGDLGKGSLVCGFLSRNANIVDLLLGSSSVDVNDKDADGCTPLHWAVLHGIEAVWNHSAVGGSMSSYTQ